MKFSVLTATYNRAHTLPRVYETLCEQSLKDFEWLIMDDGSSDDTEQLVNSWISEAKLSIKYFKQANGGKHRALNGIVPEAQGEFSVILDSDDTLTPTALERFLYHWESIPEESRHEFAGISGLCQTQSGEIMGDHIPGGILDTNNMEVMYVYQLGGDRKGCILTEIQQQHLWLEFEGENFITDSIVWHKMGRKYKYRYVDEVVCITDYLEDGITQNHQKLLCHNPKGSSAYYQNILDDPTKLPLKIRAGLYAYYVRYAMHAGYSFNKIISDAPKSPLYMGIGVLAGPLFYWRDKLKGFA